MRGHVDAESLALCAEGLLSRRRSERLRSHVASCPECAAAQARLTEIPGLLASVPPPALPPGIAARLDAALSAEVARRAGPEPGTAPAHPAPARHPDPDPVPGRRPAGTRAGGPHGPRFRVPARVLAAAAGILVVAGGVGYAVSQSSSPLDLLGIVGIRSGARDQRHGRAAGSAPRRPVPPPATGQGGSAGFTVSQSGTRYGKTTFAAQAAAVLSVPLRGPEPPREEQWRPVPAGPRSHPVRGQGRGPGRGTRGRGQARRPGAVPGAPGHRHRGPGHTGPARHGLRGRGPLFRHGSRHPGPRPAAGVGLNLPAALGRPGSARREHASPRIG